MSELFLQRNDLPAARRHLQAGAELGEHAGLPQNRHRSRIALARVHQAEGDLAAALDLLNEAELLYVSDLFPDVRPIAALRARLWLAQGRVDHALHWARDRGLGAQDDLSYLCEFQHVTLARALLAQSATTGDQRALRDGTQLLQRLLHAADDGGRTGSLIEILVLLAMARHASGDAGGALEALARAVVLAEPEDYLRVFLDEGPPMEALLRAFAKQDAAGSFHVRRLLDAFSTSGHPAPVQQRALIEPLSARELEVLRLLGTELDGPGIARELFVSLNTVRTHTKNIYAKLGVNGRRAAVRRGADLNLLSRNTQP